MMRLTRFARTSLACCALAGSALAQAPAAKDFVPNALFVVHADGVAQLAPDCSIAGQLAGELAAPSDLAFGPNGHLYVVAGDGVVHELASDGADLHQFGAPTADREPCALAFGPDGHLFVTRAAQDRVLELDKTGATVREFGPGTPLDQPSGLAFGPAGNLFVSSAGTDRILEFVPTGQFVRELGAGSPLDQPGGLAFGPDGKLFVASIATGRVLSFDENGQWVDEIGADLDLQGGLCLAFGPDGFLYVATANGTVHLFDAAFASKGSWTSVVPAPVALAFSPYRLEVVLKLKGSTEGSSKMESLKEKAVLSIAPGSSRLMLALSDDPDDAKDLASLSGSSALVFHGFEAFENDGAKARLMQGGQLPAMAPDRGVASLSLRVEGKVGTDGRFQVKTASGTLHRSAGGFVFSGTVKTASEK